MFSLLKMTRPGNILIAALTLAVGYVLSGGDFSREMFFADAWAFSFAIAFGNILNDLLDLENDRVNCPERPLPSGKVSVSVAKAACFVCAALTLLSAATPGTSPLFHGIFFLGVLGLLFLYDRFLKRVPLLKNVTVALLCTTPIVRAAFLQNADIRPLAVAGLFAFLFTLAREILKDLEDERGDLKAGIFTFPLVAGEQRAQILSSALILFGTLSVPLPVMLGWFRPAFLLLLVPLLPTALFICRKTFQKNFRSAKNGAKIAMLFGVVALLLNGISNFSL